MNTFIEFIAKNPDTPGGNAAQTFDIAGIAIFALFAIVAVFGIVSILTSKGSIKTISSNLATKVANVFNVKILYAIFAVLAALLLIFAVMFGNKQAYADSATQTKVADKVTAYVDTNTGEISIEPGFISSTDTNIVLLNSIDLSLCDGIFDGNCNWKVSSDDQVLFEGKAGETQDLTPPFQIYQDSEVPITFSTDMNLETAKSLIGKKVASVSFDLTQKEAFYFRASVSDGDGNVSEEAVAVLQEAGWDNATGSWTKDFIEGVRHGVVLSIWDELIASEKVQAPNTYIFDSWNIVPAGERFLSSTTYTAQWVKKPIIEATILNEGVPVVGATISLLDENGNLVEKALTDSNGKYSFENLASDFKGYVNVETKPGAVEGLAGASALISVDGVTKVEVPSQPKSILTGQASDSQPGTTVKFTTEDGRVFITTTDAQGKYRLPVSASTKGNLSLDAGDDVITNNYDGITTPNPGSSSEYDFNIVPISDTSTIIGSFYPNTPGTVVYYTDSNGFRYSTITREGGQYTLIVPANDKGTVYALGDRNKSTYTYMTDVLTKEPGGTLGVGNNLSLNKTIFIRLGEQTISDEYVPEGWEKTATPHQYQKEYCLGTDNKLILDEWDPSKINPPEGKVFKEWTIVESDNYYSPSWVDANSIQISGHLIDANGHSERGVQISIYDASGNLVTTAYSDKNGNFAAFVDEPISDATIKIEGLDGYCSKEIYSDIKMDITDSVSFGDLTLRGKTGFKGTIKDSFGGTCYDPIDITFTTEDGETFTTIGKDGRYSINVYADTKGKFVFDGGEHFVKLEIDVTTISVTGLGPTTLDVVLTTKAIAAKIEGTVKPPKEGVEVSFINPNGTKNVTYTDSNGQYTLEVVPNSNGELFIFDESENLTYVVDFSSGEPSSTIPGDVTMTPATVIADIDAGTISDDKIPLGWTKLTDKTFSRNYVVGSTYKYVLSGWKEAITPPEKLYFGGWEDINLEGTLEGDITVKVHYINFVEIDPNGGTGSYTFGSPGDVKQYARVVFGVNNPVINFYDNDTGELVCTYTLYLDPLCGVTWTVESEKLAEFYLSGKIIAPLKFTATIVCVKDVDNNFDEISSSDESSETGFYEFSPFDILEELFAYKD